MAHDWHARILMGRLGGPPFTNIVEFCGAEDTPGHDEVPEWRVWTNRETSRDQAAIEDYLEQGVDRAVSIFHVGVGNSSLARRLAHRASTVRGITIHREEKEYADSFGLDNYSVSITNKYSCDLEEIRDTFDIIVDNNPASFACCLFHFCRMMVNYSEMLRDDGAILTAEPGLSWVLSNRYPGWSLTWQDWSRLGEAMLMRPRQITEAVYSLERGGSLRKGSAGEAAEPNRSATLDTAGRLEPNHARSSDNGQKGTVWSREVMKDRNWRDFERFNRACDAAFDDLTRVTPHRPFTSEMPTVICVVRNEEVRLRDFIHHYKKLGVKCLHIVDNGSTDDTPKICAADRSITLWRTDASYAEADCGQVWVGAIARQYGIGKWVFNVDADELFVYADMERHHVGDLQNWLTSHGYRRVFAPMIDMYGSRLYGTRPERDPRSVLLQNPFFDGGTHQGRPCYEYQKTPYGPLLVGGPRIRAMSTDDRTAFCLSKFPLSRWEHDTAYANVHFPYPFSDNPPAPYGALLHFKFLADFIERVREAVDDAGHWSNVGGYQDYRLYDGWIGRTNRRPELFSTECSRIYRGPESLVLAGLLEQIPWDASPSIGLKEGIQRLSVPVPPSHPPLVASVASADMGDRLEPASALSSASENQAAELWHHDAALRAVETQCDHRIEARRAILRFISPDSVGVELGVFTGLFSEFILQNTTPGVLHLVDPWWLAFGEFFPDWGEYSAHGKLSTRVAQQAALARAKKARETCRVECHVAFSVDWLTRQEDESLDWAYLDTTHFYKDTIEELELLCRKVRPNGLILGDDCYPDPSNPEHAVFRAVHETLHRHPELELVDAGLDYQFVLRIHRNRFT
jgi:glycosyltransferase involved in cell wall biosynthesis